METDKIKYYVLFCNIIYDCIFGEDDVNSNLQKRLYKVQNYAEEIVPRMRDRQFRLHFRMLPETFEHLLMKMHEISKSNVGKGHPELMLEKQLMIALWYLGNLESFRSVADRFDISKSTCWSVLIIWPSEERAASITQGFQRQAKFPGILGAIDGSHIPIKAPINSPASYINRKGFSSMLLQAVCDNKKVFIDCYTDLGCKINRGTVAFPFNSHLIGDPAYTLHSNLMVPFKDNGFLSERQKNYNLLLARARVVIEQAFALLKGRFRRLKLMETVRLDLMPLLIMSSCILHNVCLFESDLIDIDLEAEIWEERAMNPQADPQDNVRIQQNGIQKRQNIVAHLPLP